VILDAMACGKAVVASYRSWMNDYFKFGEDMISFEPENSKNLEEKVLSLLGDLEIRKKIGIEARRSIEERLNSEAMASELNRLFELV
jgi:glycosyltransferase involved in cell wall biosynthesis